MSATRGDSRKPGSYFQLERVYTGPNIHSSDPVVRVSWNNGFLKKRSFFESLSVMMEASASWVELLDTDAELDPSDVALAVGTFLTNWSWKILNAERGFVKSHGSQRDGERVISWIGYHDPTLSLQVLDHAAESIRRLSFDQDWATWFARSTASILKICRVKHPDYQAKFLMQAADALNIPYFAVPSMPRCWQYGWGRRGALSFETGIAENSYLFHQTARNKPETKAFLRSLGFPVARDCVVRSQAGLSRARRRVGFPCVTKPVDGKQSRNVTVGITSPDQLLKGFEEAWQFSRGRVLIEQMLQGDVHRLMVVRGEYLCSVRRVPASVIGDGISTIEALLDEKESNRLADPAKALYGYAVPRNDEMKKRLAKRSLSLDSVLPENFEYHLFDLPRTSLGSTLTDVTNITHRDVKQMAMAIAEAMRLQCIGIDYISRDISLPPTSTCGFLEVNSVPSIQIPLVAGIKHEKCVKAILGQRAGRIPSTLKIVSGDEFKAHKQPEEKQHGEGWVWGQTCGIGPMKLVPKTASTFECARTLLMNPRVQRIDIVTSVDDLVKNGLPLDYFDHIAFPDGSTTIPPDWQALLQQMMGGTADR
ncbi:hypothetical protein CLV88_11659 [Shimia abyssi]|uniref:ATP-grasp domain-containing protein n=2 Tax=Shimia abyssi TaxID=1662395 RepID=A0A2P8F7F7_9RHOB|nr:hypothetical protein CLV88_11659 [Shimia abyssi]